MTQYGEQAALCRRTLCVACWQQMPSVFREREDPPTFDYQVSVAAHAIKTRGAGGTDEHCIPLCSDHEREFHQRGRATFSDRYGLDLEAETEEMRRRLRESKVDLG